MTYSTAHGNAGSLTHRVRPGIELESSWILVRFISAEPCRELPEACFEAGDGPFQSLCSPKMAHWLCRGWLGGWLGTWVSSRRAVSHSSVWGIGLQAVACEPLCVTPSCSGLLCGWGQNPSAGIGGSSGYELAAEMGVISGMQPCNEIKLPWELPCGTAG